MLFFFKKSGVRNLNDFSPTPDSEPPNIGKLPTPDSDSPALIIIMIKLKRESQNDEY